MNPDDFSNKAGKAFDGGAVVNRQEVLRLRQAFVAGALHAGRSAMYVEMEARERYPLPKITRPRVVKDPFSYREWRVYGGQLQYRSVTPAHAPDAWYCAEQPGSCERTSFPQNRIRILYELINNPTEEVEDDGREDPSR